MKQTTWLDPTHLVLKAVGQLGLGGSDGRVDHVDRGVPLPTPLPLQPIGNVQLPPPPNDPHRLQ